MSCFSISSYNIIAWNKIQLNKINITLCENKRKGGSRVLIGNLIIKINNWFFFIIAYILFHLLNISSFLFIIKFLSGKFIGIYINDLDCYIEIKKRILNEIETKDYFILKLAHIFSYIRVSNAFAICKVQLGATDFFFGLQIGFLSLCSDESGKYTFLLRRMNIRYRKIDSFDLKSFELTKDIHFNLKETFVTLFSKKSSYRLLNIPGITSTKINHNIDKISIIVREEYFNNEFSGIYLSFIDLIRLFNSFRLYRNTERQELQEQKNSHKFQISFIFRRLNVENLWNGIIFIFCDFNVSSSFKLNDFEGMTIEINHSSISFQMSCIRLAEIYGLKLIYNKVDHVLNIELGLFRLNLFSNIIPNKFSDYCKIVEIPSIIFLVFLDFSKEKYTKCLVNTDISGSLILLNNSGTNCYINKKDVNLEKELFLLNSDYHLISNYNDLFVDLESDSLSEIPEPRKSIIELQITFSSGIEIIDESFTVLLNLGNEKVILFYNLNETEIIVGDLYILIKQINNYKEEKYIKQRIVSFVFRSCKTIQDGIHVNSMKKSIEISDYTIEINNILLCNSSRINFINYSDGNKTLCLNSLYLRYKIPINWETKEAFLSTKVDEINIKSEKSFIDFEILSINRLVMFEESDNILEVCHELLNLESTLIIHNFSNFHGKKLLIKFPRIKLNVSKSNISNLSDLLMFFERNLFCKNSPLLIENEETIELIFDAITINIFEFDGDKYNILTIYSEKSNGRITLNQKGDKIKYNIDKIRFFIGEDRKARVSFVDFHFANEMIYFLIEKNYLHDIICYEFVEEKSSNDYSMKRNEFNYYRDSLYPVLLSELDIFLNISLKRVSESLEITHFSADFGKFQSTTGAYIILDVIDILKMKKFFNVNKKTKSTSFLFKILNIDNLFLKIPSITLVLLNSKQEKRDKISVDIEELNIVKNNLSYSLKLNKFRILFFYPSKNILDQQIKIYINDFHEINKFYTENIEINEILNVNLLNLYFSFCNNKVTRIDIYVEVVKSMLIKEFLNNLNQNIATFFHGDCSYNQFFIVRHCNYSPLKVLIRNIRQCPNFNKNIIQSSKNKLLLIHYIEIHCLLKNLKLSCKGFELNLNRGSRYLIELNNFYKYNFNNIISGCSYYPGYLTNNNYLDSTIKISSDRNLLSKYLNSLISFQKIKDRYYSGMVLLGMNIRICSEIKQDLNLFFSPNVIDTSNLNSYHCISENKYFQCSIEFLIENNYIYIFQKENEKNYNYNIGSEFKEKINFLDIFNSVTSGSEYFYCDYKIINSNFYIGIECLKYNRTIFIKLFNIINLVNISGIKLNYYIFNSVDNYKLSEIEKLKHIENFKIEFIIEVDYKKELDLIIETSKNYFNKLKINLERDKLTVNSCLYLETEEYSHNKEFYNLNNKIKLNVCIFVDKHRFYIIIWPSIVVFNLTDYDFILSSLEDERELYYINRRKYAYRKKILHSIAIIGKTFYKEKNKILSLFTTDNLIKYEFEILSEYENEFSNLVIDYNNNISIKIKDYRNYIENEEVYGIIKNSSLKIKSISIEPYWSITNNSSFKLEIFSNNSTFNISPTVGYLDTIKISDEKNNYEHESNHLLIRFDNFVTNYVINIGEKNSYNDVVNLYYSNSLSKLWEIIDITVTISDSTYDFYPEYNIIFNDFDEEKSVNYYILNNKTKNSYLLSQIDTNLDFEKYLLFNKVEHLPTKVWKNTFLEKINCKIESESKRKTISSVSSICLFPDYIIDKKLIYWGNDIRKSFDKLILVEYLDRNNNRVELDKIYFTDNRSVTRRFNYGFCDLNNNVKVVQLAINIIKFENGIFQIYFHDLSLLSIQMAPCPPFFPLNNCFNLYIPKKEAKLELEIVTNIKLFRVSFGTVFSEGVVISKKGILKLSPIGTLASSSPMLSTKIDTDLLKLIPSTTMILSNLEIVVKKNKLFELCDSSTNFVVACNAKIINFAIFRRGKTIIEILSNKKNNSPTIEFSIFEGRKTNSRRQDYPKKYQVYNININLPSLNVDLKLNDYLNMLKSEFIDVKKDHVWNLNNEEESGVFVYFDKLNLFVQRITINNILFLLNYRDSLETQVKLHLKNNNILFDLIKNKVKTIVKNIVKSILLKRISSVVNFNILK